MLLQHPNSSLQGEKHEERQVTLLFLIPVFLFLGVFIVFSIAYCFRISLFDWNGLSAMDDYIGFDNWVKLAGDGTFWSSLVNNLKLMFMLLVIELPISIAMAYFLDLYGKKANIFKVVWFLPILMSSTAVGTLFSFFFDNYFGPIAGFMKLFGMRMPSLLGDPDVAIYAVGFVIVWQYVPFYMVYFLAGISSIPEEIYEASIIDGAKRSQYFFKCALPMLAPTVRNAIVLQLVSSLKYFDLVYVLTGGGPSGSTELMATYMYRQSFLNSQMGYGSAVACGMFIVITILALTTVKLLNRNEE